MDLLSTEHTDAVLEAKMRLVNDAIDEIGFTNYHWQLFWCVLRDKFIRHRGFTLSCSLNGFGLVIRVSHLSAREE